MMTNHMAPADKMMRLNMRRLRYSLLVLGLSALFPASGLAIVNMDGLHFGQQKDAFSADFDLSASGSSGNSKTSVSALNGQFSWITQKSINLALIGFKYGESNNTRSVNKAFVHYRFIHQIHTSLDWEIFGQLEKNEFTRLSYRGLLGAGFRSSFSTPEKHSAFLGVGGFYSKEKIEVSSTLTDEGVEELVRANVYFLSRYRTGSQVSFSNAVYYQPRADRVSDYRALFQTKVDFKISETLSFRLTLDIEYDSEPSQTVKSTDTSYMAGVKLHF